MRQENELKKQKQTKKTGIIAGILLGIICSFAVYGKPSMPQPIQSQQNTTTVVEEEEQEEEEKIEEEVDENGEKVWIVVDVMPSYSGGQEALNSFLAKNLKYPVKAIEKGIQGTVYVQFVVEKDGGIGKVKIVRSANKYLDKEAIRVIKLMPEWNPGMQEGEAVRTWFTLPVRFKFE
jgi:protein TonB